MGASVFMQKYVWFCCLYVAVISSICATGMFFVPSAKAFDTSRFREFCTFLKVFISFMIGIYVQHSFGRWWNTVMCFEDLLIAIKQLVFMLHSLKVDSTTRETVERYAVAACHIMCAELPVAQQVKKKNHVSPIPGVLNQLVSEGYIDQEERDALLKCEIGALQVSRAVWSWIAEILTNVCKPDGSPLPPPMFIKTLSLCQSCIGKIEHVKRNVTVQTPFMYAHLLSVLVHTNNTFLAVFGGLTLGSAFHEVVDRGNDLQGVTHPSNHILRNFYGAIQITGGQIVIMLVEPMLYVGFLQISHMLCYPFGNESFNLPTEAFVAKLQVELHSMADNRDFFRKNFAGKTPRCKRDSGVHTPGMTSTMVLHRDDVDDDEDGDDDGGD
jgi:hypothetical protein